MPNPYPHTSETFCAAAGWSSRHLSRSHHDHPARTDCQGPAGISPAAKVFPTINPTGAARHDHSPLPASSPGGDCADTGAAGGRPAAVVPLQPIGVPRLITRSAMATSHRDYYEDLADA